MRATRWLWDGRETNGRERNGQERNGRGWTEKPPVTEKPPSTKKPPATRFAPAPWTSLSKDLQKREDEEQQKKGIGDFLQLVYTYIMSQMLCIFRETHRGHPMFLCVPGRVRGTKGRFMSDLVCCH
ncbi:PREDICTED: uncharacterized protein LOC104810702 [Tarenaya hassleriana]|uniref:uncharacterized protein LOC104810702 n=1 Tax=Tarenaya hassleriana TaxID=28532 RepID=UPI00053C733E|nr:PREDICTED: uncharacterized protein LOC104810702 [Tarenaya hassleriana]